MMETAVRINGSRNYYQLTLLFVLSGFIVFVSTLPYGYLLPVVLIGILYSVWSFTKPIVALSTIILLYLHLLQKTAEITPIEIFYGCYMFGYIGYWFIVKILIRRERVVLTHVDYSLLAFLVICCCSVLPLASTGGSILMWFRELLTYLGLLLYFPLRDSLKKSSDVKIVFGAALTLVLAITFSNLLQYRSESLVAQYLWELEGSRKIIGAHYFYSVFLFSLALYIYSNSIRLRIVYIGIMMVTGTAMILTFARGFWLGAVAGVTILFFLQNTKKKLTLVSLSFISSVVLVVFILIFAGRVGEFVWEAVARRAVTSGSGFQDPSVAERLAESRAVIALVKDNPMTGYGIGATFKHFHILSKMTVTWLYIHNGYLFILFKVGILGLAAFLSFYISSIIKAVKATRTTSVPHELKPLLQGVIAVMGSGLLLVLSSNIFYEKESLLILTLCTAFVNSPAINKTTFNSATAFLPRE